MSPQFIESIRLVRLSPQSLSWPSTKGKAEWKITTSSSSTSGASGKRLHGTHLTCRYTYTVDGVEYSGRFFDLARRIRSLTLKETQEALHIDAYKEQYKKEHGKPPHELEGYNEALAAAMGKSYEDESSSVTVYYDPDDPALSVLEPREISFTDNPGDIFVLSFLVLSLLCLLIFPIKVLRWRSRQNE